MTLNLFETLRYFMEAPSVTGFEQQRRERIIEVFSKYCDSVSVDVMGNVIGVLGEGTRNVMLAGHYDQLGFMITHVDKDGFAGFTQVGGWDKRVAYGTRVKIWIGDGLEDYIVGVVAVKAAHLTDAKERDKTPDLKDMLIDLGVNNKEEAEKLGIKPATVYDWTHRRKIPYVKLGGKLKFIEDQIDEFVLGKVVLPQQ